MQQWAKYNQKMELPPPKVTRAFKWSHIVFAVLCLIASFIAVWGGIKYGAQLQNQTDTSNGMTLQNNASSTISHTSSQSAASPTQDSIDTDSKIKYFTLNLSEQMYSPDGIAKLMMVANRQLDYKIEVNSGDIVVITVNNEMSQPTSIHWHGLFQVNTPWMDGSAMVTQCLIQSGDSMTYNFTVADQTGTYWWHAHSSQYVDGLRGPFIIHDLKDPYRSQYDEEIVMTLSDHFHKSAEQVLASYVDALDPVPDSGLINGAGQCNCKFFNTSSCNPNNLLTVFNIAKGRRYRVRVVNMSAQANFEVNIDGHNLTIIEQDGVYTNPTTVSSFSISSSQRYSFLITADALVDNYWVRAKMMDMYTPTGSVITNGLNFETQAVWRYQGAPAQNPTSVKSIVNQLDPYSLGELNGMLPDNLPNPELTIYFQYVVQSSNSSVRGSPTISDITIQSDTTNMYYSQYLLPSGTPTLQSALQQLKTANNPNFPTSSNVFPVSNSLVLLQIRNTDNIEHVFHLHGHTFYVLNHGSMLHRRQSGGNSQSLSTYPRRDSIQVPACTGGAPSSAGVDNEAGCTPGFVNILINFTHPGVWLFHCHVEWHMATGLAMAFVNFDGMDTVAKAIPSTWWDRC